MSIFANDNDPDTIYLGDESAPEGKPDEQVPLEIPQQQPTPQRDIPEKSAISYTRTIH